MFGGAAWSWGQYGKYNDPEDPDFYERQQKYDDTELKMLLLMRQSLSIPGRRSDASAPWLLLAGAGSPVRHDPSCVVPVTCPIRSATGVSHGHPWAAFRAAHQPGAGQRRIRDRLLSSCSLLLPDVLN